jgi:hypothetical protein
MTTKDILQILLVIAAAIGLVLMLRWRRRGHARFMDEFAGQEVCEHLKPALDLLRSRGHHVVRAGQRSQYMPLEIYLAPVFDPQALADELGLDEPVIVSERRALVCQEDYCELRPLPR